MFDKHFVGGFCGGITGTVAAYPLDTVKVRIQSGCLAIEQPSIRQVIKISYYTSDKFRALFRGIASPLVTLAPSNALAFYVENRVMKHLQDETIRNHVIAGAASGVFQAMINSPTELVKIQMQIDNTKFKNSFYCAKTIVSDHGLLKLRQGMLITLCREIPAFAGYFGAYDLIVNDVLNYQYGDAAFDDIKPFIAGGFAGMFSWYLTYPIDCIKTRIQAQDMSSKSKLTIRTVWKDLKAEGELKSDMYLRSAGMKATLVRAFICNSVTFGTVALVLQVWDKLGRIF